MKTFEKARHIRKYALRMSLTSFQKKLVDFFGERAPTYETLCRFENGHLNATIRTKTLHMIATGLGIPLEELKEDKLNIAGNIAYPYNEDAAGKVLTPPQSRFLAIALDIKPGGFTREERDPTDKHEKLVSVIRGEVLVYVGKEKRLIKYGDSIYFASNVAHHLENPSKKTTARCIMIRNPKS
jgi:quercetin dioxygenase-like cupin family protein